MVQLIFECNFPHFCLVQLCRKVELTPTFNQFSGRIVDQGPSIIVVEDKHGYMFGGFAPASWSVGPNFFGDDSSFLFTLAPRMRIFSTSGYNQHFQYLNIHQQTMPNGLVSEVNFILFVINLQELCKQFHNQVGVFFSLKEFYFNSDSFTSNIYLFT